MDKQTSIALAELFLKGAEDTATRAIATGNDALIKRANIALEIAKRDLIEALQIEELRRVVLLVGLGYALGSLVNQRNTNQRG